MPDDDLEADIEAGPGAGALPSGRGAPLLPYDASPDALSGFQTQDRGLIPQRTASFGRLKIRMPIGARYYEADAIAPARWSRERIAQLQRNFAQMGLYGDKKYREGVWDTQTQQLFTRLLAAANVEGREWAMQLLNWRVRPPEDLLEEVRSSTPAKPTIRLTNPDDIRSAARATSRELTGSVQRPFLEHAVGGFQARERAAQEGVIADQGAGGGGVVTDAPSLGGYLEEQVRRDMPLEVDGYQFLNQFEGFLSMLGAS